MRYSSPVNSRIKDRVLRGTYEELFAVPPTDELQHNCAEHVAGVTGGRMDKGVITDSRQSGPIGRARLRPRRRVRA
jgi:hypothetical protein